MKEQTASPTLLRDIKACNATWFSASNKRFFNDRQYWGYFGVASGYPYLLRSTYAWTDMFDQPRRLHYRIDHIDAYTHVILGLIDEEFATLDDARAWLRLN